MHAWSLPRRRGRFLLATLLAAVPFSTAAASVPDARAAAAPRALAIPFAANPSHFDRRVAFSAATPGETVFVTRDGRIVHSLRRKAAPAGEEATPGWTLTESFVGGRVHATGGRATPTRVSRFVGNDPARWAREAKTYASVELGDVWRGVRVSLDTTSGGIERIFRLAPGVSEDAISVRLAGAASLAVAPDASLCARTGLGDVTLSAPIAWQEDADGGRTPVAVSYRVRGNRYGFRLGPHDPHRATTIDPLIRATFLGGTDRDDPSAVAVNPSTGDILVAGVTASTDFPGTAGGAQTTYGGFAVDGFVARLSGDLKTLKQVTYIGGSQNDYLQDVLVHPGTGEVVVMGVTRSTDLPGTAGGALGYGGNGDNFVARFNANLTSLLQTTYFGGSGAEALYVQGGIAVDAANGDIYISGNTSSTDLPGTTSAAQKNSAGGIDGYVAHFNSSLTSLVGATYFGGTADDSGGRLLVEPVSRDVIVVGFAKSSDLPGTSGGAQAKSGGGQDGFVARFDRTLATLVKATYLGGGGTENAVALALHGNGNLLVAGGTTSSDFPGITGAQTDLRGASDAFVAELPLDLTEILFATYLGGSFGEGASAILPVYATAAASDIYVAGTTNSYDFPGTEGAIQPQAHASDLFLARLTHDLSAIEIATYVGGRAGESNAALAMDPVSTDAIIVGETTSPTMPGTGLAAQPQFGGGSEDVFVARLTQSLDPEPFTGAFAPVNIVVDFAASATSDGDQVFEPGETILVAPFWKNIIAFPLSVTGAGDAFSGPAGPTYSRPDAAAAYADTDPGKIVNCASELDCYTLSVSGTRPATHWDAAFHETLSNGDEKTWTLHIGDSFTDVPRNQTFYKKIETIFHAGVTTGCSPTQYCPGQAVPRDQMAIFLAKVIAGGGANVPVVGQVNGRDYRCGGGLSGISIFTDVSPSDPACKHIHYIAAQNVTLGCSATQFCPAALVDRDAMAAFIAKAYVAPNGGPYIPDRYGPDPVTGLSYSCNAVVPNTHFSDVPVTDPFCKFVHYLWVRGFVGGCTATAYCPTGSVTRDAMAKFLVNSFDLRLYGP